MVFACYCVVFFVFANICVCRCIGSLFLVSVCSCDMMCFVINWELYICVGLCSCLS